MTDLDDAIEQAKTSNRAITFFWSDENTSCSLATKASLNIINEMRDNILVYVDSKRNEAQKLPKVVFEAFRSSKAGRYIPITVITNSRADRIIDIIPYKRSSEEHIKLIRKAKEKILISEQPSLKNTLMNIISTANKYRIQVLIVGIILLFILFKK